MAPTKSINEVQRLTGGLTALRRLFSRSGDRCLPFFNALKKVNDFKWNEDAQKYFYQLKEYFLTITS